MGASKTQIMNYLEMRFDYQSARNVLNNWRRTVGIKDELESLDDCQLKCLLAYLKTNAADATRVHAAIERLILSDCEACCASVEETVVETPVEETVVETPVEETVVDAPVEDAVVDAPVEDAVVETPVEDAVVETPIEETVDAAAEETVETSDDSADTSAAEDAPAPKKSKKKSKH
ncbi:MAG: hypothetical protein J6S69_10210 [Proteobacteria bacterium]|nr:hypothetical protein [Pseudomonadota bacterium]